MGTDATVAVFPGQGSQKTGMAQDFYDSAPQARAVFEAVSDALSVDMTALCFKPDERLHLTAFTQPAILTAEIAIFSTLRAISRIFCCGDPAACWPAKAPIQAKSSLPRTSKSVEKNSSTGI